MKDMVNSHTEKDNWTFVYLGANQDSWAVGASFGIAHGNTMNFNTQNMAETYKGLAAASASYSNSSFMTKSLRGAAATYGTSKLFEEAGLKEEDFDTTKKPA